MRSRQQKVRIFHNCLGCVARKLLLAGACMPHRSPFASCVALSGWLARRQCSGSPFLTKATKRVCVCKALPRGMWVADLHRPKVGEIFELLLDHVDSFSLPSDFYRADQQPSEHIPIFHERWTLAASLHPASPLRSSTHNRSAPWME